jgi:PadR family transcriptional regulator PadR
MDKNISSDLIRGHINTIILRSLYDGDKYGYEIIKEIEDKSERQYELKQPTLYSSLNRLESLGHIESYWGGAVNGGRRKYFKLTETGREIAKQNLSEWEYSRTIIDKLISERDFDLKKPAPAPIDFNLLKQTTTKVPSIITVDNKKENQNQEENKNLALKLIDEKIETGKKYQSERDNRLKLNELFENTIKVYNQTEKEKEIINIKISEQKNKDKNANKNTKNEEFDLIVDDINSNKINFSDLFEIAEQDGIKIRTCNSSDIKRSKFNYFNKGKLAFFAAILMFFTAVIELALALFVFDELIQINFKEATYVLGVFLFILMVTLFAYLFGYGKDSMKINNKKNISAAVIISLNIFLLICALSLVFNINLTNTKNLFKYIIFPLILLFNIPLSILYYNLLTKKTRMY